MRVNKKCLMLWLNPITLIFLMISSCTCSKLKILEENEIVFSVAACFVLYKFDYVLSVRWFFSTVNFFFYYLVPFLVCEFTDPSDVFSLGVLVGFIKVSLDR